MPNKLPVLPPPDELDRVIPTPNPYYTFSDGTRVKLSKIPPLVLVGVQSEVDKPVAPTRIIHMAGGGTRKEPREDDEPVLTEDQIALIKDPKQQEAEVAYREYRAKLAQWQTDSEYRLAKVVFLLGVEDGPPPEQVQLWQTIGFTRDYEIKYNWLAAKLKTEDEMSDFFECVMSQTVATQQGIELEEARFPGAVARQSGPVEGSGPVAGEAEARIPETEQTPA